MPAAPFLVALLYPGLFTTRGAVHRSLLAAFLC
jgi:hypothetical protein